MAVCIAGGLLAGCANAHYNQNYTYVKDEHQPGQCLIWQDRDHLNRSGEYCLVSPLPIGTK